GGQRGRGGPAGHPGVPGRLHPDHRGLLQHDLADQHSPGARAGLPPGQIAEIGVVPRDGVVGESHSRTYCRRVHELAITVIGPARTGIVADVAEALAGVGATLTDSTMTRLRGHFTMTLVCTGPTASEASAVLDELTDVVTSVRPVSPEVDSVK